jgi:hypothetical protein
MTRIQRLLERLRILTDTEPPEIGWHVQARDWPAADSLDFETVRQALDGVGDSAEAAWASLRRAGRDG